jgi:hypothetical protein
MDGSQLQTHEETEIGNVKCDYKGCTQLNTETTIHYKMTKRAQHQYVASRT